jgi:hypothetical protein
MEIITRRSWTVIVPGILANGLKDNTAPITFWARGGLVFTRGARLFRVAVIRVGSLFGETSIKAQKSALYLRTRLTCALRAKCSGVDPTDLGLQRRVTATKGGDG